MNQFYIEVSMFLVRVVDWQAVGVYSLALVILLVVLRLISRFSFFGMRR